MAIIKGTNYDDDIFGTNSADTIYGYGGADIIYGYAGNDVLYGGAGNDDLIGGLGANNLYGGSGSDYFTASARSGTSDNYVADFEFDIDRIDLVDWGVSDLGQVRAMLTTASNGNALFNAYYNGYNNYFELNGVRASDLLSNDFVFNTGAGRRMNGTSYNDTLFGSRYNDSILGNGGNDYLMGGGGHDQINGGAGNDRLYGGSGADTMAGSAGSDYYIYFSTAESVSTARDLIYFQEDFDRLYVSPIDARTDVSGNQAFSFIGAGGFSASGQVRYQFYGDDTLIQFNTDRDATAEMEIRIAGRHYMIASDFVL